VIAPETAIRQFEKKLPQKFEAMHSVVITIKPHWWWPAFRQVAIGYSRVDRQADSFDVTCLSPLGMKLLSISRTNGQTSGMFLLPVKGKQDAMISSTGDAIFRAYFDMAPTAPTRTSGRHHKLVFEQTNGNRMVRYTFSSESALLLSKEYYEGKHLVMTVTYDKYPSAGERASLPLIMTLRDHRYGFRLEFQLREYRDVSN